MTMKTKHTLLWLLPFAIVWFWGSNVLAVDPSIKLSTPVVAKNSDGTQFVTLKYNIKDVPAGGSIIVLKIDCHEENKGDFQPEPLASEVSGTGLVEGDGEKSIVWQDEKTLVRIGKQGKYQCTFHVSIQGDANSVSGATLTINKYAPSGWTYMGTGTASMSVEKRTGNTPEFKCPELGVNWSNVAKSGGATFYKIKPISQFPDYKGKNSADQFKGSVTRDGCSSFIGIKDYGKPTQIIWACFSKQFYRAIDPIVADYEFQYRVIQDGASKTTTATVGNAGHSGQNIYSELNKLEDFVFTLEVGKIGEETTDPFEINVPRREWKYFNNGKHIFTVRVQDKAASFDGVKGSNTIQLVDGDAVEIGSVLRFSGKTFKIDTTPGACLITYDGSILANGNPISEPFVLGTTGFITLNDSLVFSTPFISPSLVLSAAAGFSVNIERMRTTGDPDNPDGVLFDIRVIVSALSEGCEEFLNLPVLVKAGAGGFVLKDIGIAADGSWQWPTMVQVSNIKFAGEKKVCLKNFQASYDKTAKKFNVDMLFSSEIISDATAGFTLLEGRLDGFKIGVKLSKNGLIVPFPEPPIAEWRGFEAEVSNIQRGPFTIRGTVFFANIEGWKNLPCYDKIVQKLPFLDGWQVFEIEGSVVGSTLGDMTIDGKGRIFGKADIWAAQLGGTFAANFNKANNMMGISVAGTIGLVQLGGNQWMVSGTEKGSITLLPDFVYAVNIRGDIYIPDLFKNHPFFQAINSKFNLPYRAASTQIMVRNTLAAFDLDLRWMGAWSMWIDVSKSPFTDLLHFAGIQKGSFANLGGIAFHGKGNEIQTDTAYLPFVVNNARYAYAQINSQKQPTTFLIDPSGTVIKATLPDSSVIFSPAANADDCGLWVLKNPTNGTWKLGVVGRSSGDSISFYAMLNPRSAFKPTVTSIGRTLYCTWDKKGAPDSSMVDIYLDTDSEGSDGFLVATVPEKEGVFSYTMSDTLPACRYYVYCNRFDSESISPYVYSSTGFDNNKKTLAAPTSLRVVCDLHDKVSLSWAHNTDADARFMVIYARGANGVDSAITTVEPYQDAIDLIVPHATQYHYSIQSFGNGDVRGCKSEFGDIVLEVQSDEAPSAPLQSTIDVVPNPALTRAVVRFRSIDESQPSVVTIVNLLGQTIASYQMGSLDIGEHELNVDVASLPPSMYTIRFFNGSLLGSTMLSVIR